MQLAQGGSRCSDREAGAVLGDAQQAKRVRTVGQAPRFLIQIQRPSSRCAPSTTAQGLDQRAAASLLHAEAFGLRAPLAGDQVGG